MSKWIFSTVAVALLSMLQMTGFATGAQAADAYRLTGPSVHDNLAVYFIHGHSRPGPVPFTLQEALANKTVAVHETGRVNELEVENTGDEAVYIQSGDIVKGGRQDRVLSVSMLLPPHSGVVPVRSYCVEQHRWTGRPGESATTFDSASALLPSRAAKMAMRAPHPDGVGSGAAAVFARQEQIWNDVTAIQGRLSSSLGASVAAPRSRSSLQLALENKTLERKRAAFVSNLQKSGETDDDIIGYVVAINGHLNSAEIYPSNGLFRKMWPALLRASANEAIKDRNGSSDPSPALADVTAFLTGAQNTTGIEERAGSMAQVNVKQSPSAVLFEARPAIAPASAWINRSYLAK